MNDAAGASLRAERIVTIHPLKTKIVCLRRDQTKQSIDENHNFVMGGFAFAPNWVKVAGEWTLQVLPSPSKAAKKSIMDNIRSLKLHT